MWDALTMPGTLLSALAHKFTIYLENQLSNLYQCILLWGPFINSWCVTTYHNCSYLAYPDPISINHTNNLYLLVHTWIKIRPQWLTTYNQTYTISYSIDTTCIYTSKLSIILASFNLLTFIITTWIYYHILITSHHHHTSNS